MDTTSLIEAYGELGALGMLAILLSLMINSLLKENRSQTEHIDEIQQDLAKIQSEMTNTMNICVKLIDSINAFKNSFNDKMDRRHERLNESLDELEKSVHYMQGRLNGNK
jgi:septal ring factor EnvC (AmiA/AmiB activator)